MYYDLAVWKVLWTITHSSFAT